MKQYFCDELNNVLSCFHDRIMSCCTGQIGPIYYEAYRGQKINWDEFKKSLRDIEFNGTFSFETLPPDKLPESVFEDYCRMYANLAREMVRDL